MKTNKLLFLFLFTVLTFSSYAQKKVDFGVQAGYSYAMPKVKSSQLGGNLNGIHFGPTLKYNINEKVGIQTGLLYNYNNTIISKITVGDSKTWQQTRILGHSLDVPLRAIYSISLADDFYILLGAGPNFNYALSKYNQKENYVNGKIVDDLTLHNTNIYASPSDFNPFDVQMSASVGIQYMKISLQASYAWGIMDRDKTVNGTNRENNIKVSLGYSF